MSLQTTESDSPQVEGTGCCRSRVTAPAPHRLLCRRGGRPDSSLRSYGHRGLGTLRGRQVSSPRVQRSLADKPTGLPWLEAGIPGSSLSCAPYSPWPRATPGLPWALVSSRGIKETTLLTQPGHKALGEPVTIPGLPETGIQQAWRKVLRTVPARESGCLAFHTGSRPAVTFRRSLPSHW